MRFATAALKAALNGALDFQWVADVSYAGSRILTNVPVTNVRMSDDGTAEVQGTASLRIVWQDDFGQSVAPTQIGDVLAPFGTQVSLSVLVTIGDGFVERVQMGVYLVSETPSIVTTRFRFKGGIVSAGDIIDVNLKDLLYGVQRDRFDVPGVAPDLSSVWREVQRLTELPITRTVTDLPISAAVAYEDSKLDAVYDLATVLDATAYMTPDGTVSMRPVAWPPVVDTISDGDEGTLVSVARGMENGLVYNKVVIRTNGSDGQAVLATAEVTDGPLRVRNADGSLSPYRSVPYFYSSDYITTQAQAQAYADLLLPRISRLRSVTVKVTEFFNPLREVGDVVQVSRLGESFVGRVQGINRSDGRTQETTLAVTQ